VIEVDRVSERLVFTAPNKSGFSGNTLRELEEGANSSMVAARQLLSIIDDMKDLVSERAPALLGYEGYVSRRVQRKNEDDAKEDKLLKDLKAYLKPEEGDAI
jgi:hypothetical protein